MSFGLRRVWRREVRFIRSRFHGLLFISPHTFFSHRISSCLPSVRLCILAVLLFHWNENEGNCYLYINVVALFCFVGGRVLLFFMQSDTKKMKKKSFLSSNSKRNKQEWKCFEKGKKLSTFSLPAVSVH